MTNKEYNKIKNITKFLAIAYLGLVVGSLITSLRYDSEIRTDQLELKAQVAEIDDDSEIIDGLVKELINQVEQLKLERQKLQHLQKLLSRGE